MDRASWVAIDASTDRGSRARALARIHREMTARGEAPAGLRDPIARSWRRCASAGVDPERGTAPVTLSPEEAAARWRDHPLSIAEPLLRELLADVRSDDQQVVLACDADGSLLWIDGEAEVLDAAHAIHLEPGALWSEPAAGTNAMGTALALDHPIQVFSAEHFTEAAHGWTCSAAPVHDPETGRRLGVIDLSGEISTAHPHTLALVAAAARVIEQALRERMQRRHARLRDRWGARLGGHGGAGAVASPAGTVVAASPEGWLHGRLEIPAGGGVVDLPGGERAIGEPLPEGAGFLLWRDADGRPARARRALRLEALGRDRARVATGVAWTELSRRHSEIVVLLTLVPEGLEAEELGHELYGDYGLAVSARAELSRLRRVLGGRLPRGEHRIAGAIDADFVALERLARSGEAAVALERYPGPLLPHSAVPLVIEARERLDLRLREAALASADAAMLTRWLDTPSGRDDIAACRALVRCLPADDPARVDALSRLRRLSWRASRG